MDTNKLETTHNIIQNNANLEQFKSFLDFEELSLERLSMWELLILDKFFKLIKNIFANVDIANKYFLVSKDDNFSQYILKYILCINKLKLFYLDYDSSLQYKEGGYENIIKYIKDTFLTKNFYEYIIVDKDIYSSNFINNTIDILETQYNLTPTQIDKIYLDVNDTNYNKKNYKLGCAVNFYKILDYIYDNIDDNKYKSICTIKDATKNFLKIKKYEVNKQIYYFLAYNSHTLTYNNNDDETKNYIRLNFLLDQINKYPKYFIQAHMDRKKILTTNLDKYTLVPTWNQFKEIILYSRDFYRYLSDNLIDKFIKYSDIYAEKLDKLSKKNKKITNVLVPGDSVSKVVKYIQKLNLCPKCNFIFIPISEITDPDKISDPDDIIYIDEKTKINTLEYIKSFIPSDYSNLIFFDFISSGATLKTFIKALKYKSDAKPNSIYSKSNKKMIEKLEKEAIVFLSEDKDKNKYKYKFEHIFDPVSEMYDMDDFNPLVINCHHRCIPSNPEHKKVDQSEYAKLQYDCDLIVYIIILCKLNPKFFKNMKNLYSYDFLT